MLEHSNVVSIFDFHLIDRYLFGCQLDAYPNPHFNLVAMQSHLAPQSPNNLGEAKKGLSNSSVLKIRGGAWSTSTRCIGMCTYK
jgi:hypothetical protein